MSRLVCTITVVVSYNSTVDSWHLTAFHIRLIREGDDRWKEVQSNNHGWKALKIKAGQSAQKEISMEQIIT